ncbi:SsgA family sporulation/cell division regulator [Streptomyces thermoviolaceus]|nr:MULTISPECIES: SsgA family sporulation/cell division regulator [Streptomyces]MCM3265526.1 SsgA family sporulation/cell division regulator [Streptomyces thermoviolaceus]RSS02309.1 SsgA family sporulation/cell division regulator [Streptomyces sp. WAC00469]WTD49049.1 SsgA family sporulation/cell division regulator [Streptomyces thermoviolaceus]GGV73894.1 sporulation protein SsgA [Streptomyces thermoviolaceus subsp. apingens]GHB07699.1 sporulation protein SsgA [Streptomyces thermoviolaceus subsp
MKHTVVERELQLRLIVSSGRVVPVRARLAYRTADPYAVHVDFHVDSACPVHWAFARDLLLEGMGRPCGQGDVRVWPAQAEHHDVVVIELDSPAGEALLEAPAAPVARWLEETLRVVPPGSEGDRLGIDEELAGLLAP